jgi:hypothetical protein
MTTKLFSGRKSLIETPLGIAPYARQIILPRENAIAYFVGVVMMMKVYYDLP